MTKLTVEQQTKIEELQKLQKQNTKYKPTINPKIESLEKCFVCGSQLGLLHHHIKYDPSQTVIVCFECHLKIHGKKSLRGNAELSDIWLYNYLLNCQVDIRDRILKYTHFCSLGHCSTCGFNCAIRRIKVKLIKEQIRVKREVKN